MKENQTKKTGVQIREAGAYDTSDGNPVNSGNLKERFKKPLIFGLIGVVFLGCMYLIFAPSFSDKTELENKGINDDVPQASEALLESDKKKAYEAEILKEKMQQKQDALTSLSDYWSADDSSPALDTLHQGENQTGNGYDLSASKANPALQSYRSVQSTLGSFYDSAPSESMALKKEIESLKEQLADKTPAPNNIDSQLALMEKSYQMAAKYLPSTTKAEPPVLKNKDSVLPSSGSRKEYFSPVSTTEKKIVTSLYRESSLDASQYKFHTAGASHKAVQPKNSIKGCIEQTQLIVGESMVRIRLLEAAKTTTHSIPTGTVVTAHAKLQQGRLQLKITSVELGGSIIPVEITIYDLDGQQGLFVPYSPEVNALSEMAANMGTTAGTNLMLTSSASQQIAADMSKGVIQGVSGYFSKKVRTPKVTVKAGHQLFLVSKK